MAAVFGIGNPLIDVVFHATDEDLAALKLDKGIMHLVTQDQQTQILAHFADKTPEYRPGGSAPNTLLALAGLGIPGVIAGKIGNDEFGTTYTRQVGAYGITSRLVHGDGPTGSSIILVTPDGERTMNTHLGMCREYAATDIDEPLLRTTVADGGYLYFTGYMWDTETQKAAIRRAITVTREMAGRVVFDLADPFAVERYREDFLELLQTEVDVVFANRREAEILFNISAPAPTATSDATAPSRAPDADTTRKDTDGPTPDATAPSPAPDEDALRHLAALVPIVALKNGKHGSQVAHRPFDSPGDTPSQIETIAARPIRPRDTTGAGDMYAAGFLAGLARGHTPRRCGEIAGALAEEIIQHMGAQFEIHVIRALQHTL